MKPEYYWDEVFSAKTRKDSMSAEDSIEYIEQKKAYHDNLASQETSFIEILRQRNSERADAYDKFCEIEENRATGN